MKFELRWSMDRRRRVVHTTSRTEALRHKAAGGIVMLDGGELWTLWDDPQPCKVVKLPPMAGRWQRMPKTLPDDVTPIRPLPAAADDDDFEDVMFTADVLKYPQHRLPPPQMRGMQSTCGVNHPKVEHLFQYRLGLKRIAE